MVGLLGLATALPEHRVTAADTKTHLAQVLPRPQAARFAGAVEDSRIRTRYFVEPPETLRRRTTLEARNGAFAHHAAALAERAAAAALATAGVEPAAIGALVVSSSTGYVAPGLDTHLANRLRLPAGVQRLALTTLGCGGGVRTLGLAADLLRGGRRAAALAVAVETPSVWLGAGECTPADVLASITFGDGAGAAVLMTEAPPALPALVAARSTLWPDSVEVRGTTLTSAGPRHALSPILWRLMRHHLRPAVDGLLEEHHLTRAGLAFLGLHPGGPDFFAALRSLLEVDQASLRPARQVWEDHGQLASAGVFFVLRELLANPPACDSVGLLLSIGAGVSCELALLRWGTSQ